MGPGVEVMSVEVRDHHLGNLIIGFSVLVIAMSLCMAEAPTHWRAIAALFVFAKITASTLMSVFRFETRVVLDALRQSETRTRAIIEESARRIASTSLVPPDLARSPRSEGPWREARRERAEPADLVALPRLVPLVRRLASRLVAVGVYYGAAIGLACGLARLWPG